MLLFVRNPFWQAILDGRKTYELRAGARYSNIQPGATLSLNGRLRVRVEAVELCRSIRAALCSCEKSGYPLTERALAECYPGVTEFRIFHFSQIP